MRKLLVFIILAGIIITSVIFINFNLDSNDNKAITLRLQSFALSLNPLKMADVESRQVATLLYAGLIFQEQNGLVKPLVAKSWSQTGNEWTFELNSDLTFSNGDPVTADDVVSSLCKAMQPSSQWAWALSSIEHFDPVGETQRQCTGIHKIGNNAIKIIETKPVPWLLDALSGPAGWITPQNAEEGPYGIMPSVGPYTVKEIIPDVMVVLEARHSDSVIMPGAEKVQFRYIPDDTMAAKEFATGNLDVLDLTSPHLVQLLLVQGSSDQLRYPGNLTANPWDRVRVVIINEKSLANKGFSQKQIRFFIDKFNASVDRKKIAALSHGVGIPLYSPFPPVEASALMGAQKSLEPISLPKTKLTILTEADAYSDLVAASLPKNIDNVRLDYRGVEKGIMMNSIFEGEFDLVSMIIESTINSAEFWKAFFTPGNPFTVAGKPLAGMTQLDMTKPADVKAAGNLIFQDGNWVLLLKEQRLQAVAPGIDGIRFSPSGQTNFAFITKEQ